MTKSCQWQYNNLAAYARQDNPTNPYTWSCYVSSGTAPSPTPNPSPTPPPPSPSPSPTPPPGYLAKYWNIASTSVFPPNIPTTTPTLSRTDNTINFNWGSGSPDPKITINNFVAQWTNTQNFVAGNYNFTTTSDDGMRVYIDGVIAINDWTDHAAKTTTVTKTLAAGNHTIRVDYYEHSGGAVAKFGFLKI